MPETLRITAVVTAFQCAAFLGEALESVLAQTVPPVEILVVDDGSTDGTGRVAQDFEPRVRVVSRPNGGPGAARNTGVALAREEWIAFLDGDDAWVPEKTRLQIDALRGSRGEILIFGQASNLVAPEGITLSAARAKGDTHVLAGIVAGAMLARRATLLSVGTFPESLKLGEFVDWYAHAKEAGVGTTVIGDVVLLRRIHGANQTLRERGATGDYLRVLKRALDRRRASGAGTVHPEPL